MLQKSIVRLLVRQLAPVAITAIGAAWAKKKKDQQQAAAATWGAATDVTKTPTSGSGPAGTGLN